MPEPMALRDDTVGELHQQATRVRRAIEATDLRECGNNLSGFPENCCHHAVKLLAIHLSGRGWRDLQAARGIRQFGKSPEHIWMLVENLVIDITADQFGEGLPSVIITRHSPWHATWNSTLEPLNSFHLARWRRMDDPGYEGYRQILATVASEERS